MVTSEFQHEPFEAWARKPVHLFLPPRSLRERASGSPAATL